MRVPKKDKLQKQYEFTLKNFGIKKVKHIDKFARPSFDMSDEKQRAKFVYKVKSMCRTSLEYTKLMKFLKDNLDMNKCLYFNKIDNKIKNIKIEIHHSPFSITDIINIEIERFMTEGYELNPFMIAHEILKIHYTGGVGLVPLSPTVHELVHSDKLFVPIQFIPTNVVEYYNEREKYMSTENKKKMQRSIVLSHQFNGECTVLDRRFIYLEYDGMAFPALNSNGNLISK